MMLRVFLYALLRSGAGLAATAAAPHVTRVARRGIDAAKARVKHARDAVHDERTWKEHRIQTIRRFFDDRRSR